MRDDVQGPPSPAVDEYSPTAAPLVPPTGAARSAVTDVATGVTPRAEEGVDALVGTVLADRYRIDRRLGAGGMGAVYAGFHLTLNKRIALKVIQPRLGADPTIAQRFVQEARAASAIGHEHIVQITDFGRTADEAAFIVMEYLEGEDLAETLRREGPLSWQRVVHIGEQIAWALAAAHRQGIVHRDIKPANCYRVPREHDEDFIKVLDFGLAKVLAEGKHDGESLTGTGMLLGTPGYIAPELYRGLKADHRVDIYALGALMHKLLTGELPPMASSSGAVSHLHDTNAPGPVIAVLGRAIAEAPNDRHATAQELAQALRAIPRVSPDEPTMLGRDATHASPSTGRHDTSTRDPSSAQAITLREPTPSTFPSLFTVERDGHRVRFYVGTPLIVLVLALIGGLVFYLTRPPNLIAHSLQQFRIGQIGATAGRYREPAPPPVAAPLPPLAPVAIAPTPDPASLPTPPQTSPDPKTLSPETAPPDPKTLPPETTPAPKRLKGSPRALTSYLTRKCAGGLLSYVVELRWKTDVDGLVATDSVEGKKNDDRDVATCSLRELRSSRFQWRPSTTYSETLTLGKPTPAPTTP